MGGERLAQPPRRMNYVGNGNDDDRVRGLGIFEQTAELLPELVRVGTTLELETDRCGLYVVRMPANERLVAALDVIANLRCPCRVIVDVCANPWVEGGITGDEAAVRHWTDPITIINLTRAVRAADLVTVPSLDVVDTVRSINPRIAIVPDCPDGEVTTEAMVAWTHATMIAVQRSRQDREDGV